MAARTPKPETVEPEETPAVDVEVEQLEDSPAPAGGPTHLTPAGAPVRINEALHAYHEARGYTPIDAEAADTVDA